MLTYNEAIHVLFSQHDAEDGKAWHSLQKCMLAHSVMKIIKIIRPN